MQLLDLELEPDSLSWQHAHNTLVISYAKPPRVVAAEAEDKRSAAQIKAHNDGAAGGDCKQQ